VQQIASSCQSFGGNVWAYGPESEIGFDAWPRHARTIADLEGAENIAAAHLSEAVQYRNLDRQMWMSGTKTRTAP
jgi:hypothetical protein